MAQPPKQQKPEVPQIRQAHWRLLQRGASLLDPPAPRRCREGLPHLVRKLFCASWPRTTLNMEKHFEQGILQTTGSGIFRKMTRLAWPRVAVMQTIMSMILSPAAMTVMDLKAPHGALMGR